MQQSSKLNDFDICKTVVRSAAYIPNSHIGKKTGTEHTRVTDPLQSMQGFQIAKMSHNLRTD
jgi:hypothetical protein